MNKISNLEKLADLILVCPDIIIRDHNILKAIDYFEVTEEDLEYKDHMKIFIDFNRGKKSIPTFHILFEVTWEDPYIFGRLEENKVVIPEWFREKYSYKK